MRIAIDARRTGKRISGIGRYTECLLRGLSLIDSSHQYVRIDEAAVPCDIYSIKNQIALPSFLKQEKAEIYHSPGASVPILTKKDMPYIVTVHDLIPWKYPHFIPKAKKNRLRGLFRIFMREVMKRADRIIAVSNATAADIEECFPAGSSRIRVVYNGVDPAFFGSHSAEKGGYMLYVGRRDPYKNIAAALKAYAGACEKYGIPHRFLILGEEDPRYKEAENAVEHLNIWQRVEFSGHVSHDELLKAYRGANLLVMPSRYEGFGYPVVEAMACGVPVIISQAPALVEIAGTHAISVDPDNTDEFAEAINNVLSDSALSNRLSRGGREHARNFTIEKMARETLKIYEGC